MPLRQLRPNRPTCNNQLGKTNTLGRRRRLVQPARRNTHSVTVEPWRPNNPAASRVKRRSQYPKNVGDQVHTGKLIAMVEALHPGEESTPDPNHPVQRPINERKSGGDSGPRERESSALPAAGEPRLGERGLRPAQSSHKRPVAERAPRSPEVVQRGAETTPRCPPKVETSSKPHQREPGRRRRPGPPRRRATCNQR